MDFLKRLELSVFLFLKRWSEEDIDPKLQNTLQEMAEHEYIHANTFAMLLGEKLIVSPTYAINKKEASKWGKLPWDRANKNIPVDGVSTKYLTSKVFFAGKPADSYPLQERLIYMHILEAGQAAFYQAFCQTRIGKMYPVIAAIGIQEQEHSQTFLEYLKDIPQEMIDKWQLRKNLAIAVAPIDISILLFTKWFSEIRCRSIKKSSMSGKA